MNKEKRNFVTMGYEKGNDEFWQAQFKTDADLLGVSFEEFEKLRDKPLTEAYLEEVDKELLAEEITKNN